MKSETDRMGRYSHYSTGTRSLFQALRADMDEVFSRGRSEGAARPPDPFEAEGSAVSSQTAHLTLVVKRHAEPSTQTLP
jgi:hypothetical protein